MIVLKGTIRIPKSAQAHALPALEAHIEATRLEAGNLEFRVEVSHDDEEVFHVYEVFADETSFETHQHLAAKREWGKISQSFARDYHKFAG